MVSLRLPPLPASPPSAGSRSRRSSWVRCLAPLALLALLAATPTHATAAAPDATAAAKKKTAQKTAKVAISKITVKGQRITIAGRVALPANTAKTRKRTRVALTLSASTGKRETLTSKIDAKRRFKATKTTRLTGKLTIAARVRIAGAPSGKQVRKQFKGPAAKTGPTTGGDKPNPVPPGAEKLIGLLQLDPGKDYPDGRVEGTYFRMRTPVTSIDYLHNGTSNARDTTYTLLAPGTDGGLRTDIFQPPPTPAFAGGHTGNSLANRITQPQSFFGVGFSIVTDSVDPQAGLSDPLPEIYHADGKLSGQITAWAAQWNGQSFNQGTPKPDGTTPGFTTPLAGTYDPATRRFTLGWTSLIVGGPFNGYGGQWHLEGTFVPAGG